MHQRVELKGNLIITRCRIVPQEIEVVAPTYKHGQHRYLCIHGLIEEVISGPALNENGHPRETKIHVRRKTPQTDTLTLILIDEIQNRINNTFERFNLVFLLVLNNDKFPPLGK